MMMNAALIHCGGPAQDVMMIVDGELMLGEHVAPSHSLSI
jgi:uncharacterized protein YuzB (UPF0349 family)